MSARGRHGARRLLVQALYQNQIGGHDAATLIEQFSTSKEFTGVDAEYFLAVLDEVMEGKEALDAQIMVAADRPIEQLDPVERCVLWIGVAELKSHPDIPAKVVINEAVELAKEFGALDSFRYINAILDNASNALR
ncbi:MAG: transcription antitermination factor NusB [Gammaproteobacteria bacterium]|nr:transcription antitermination factor NusB [Gammaproteobacteria bacterium]